MEQLREITFAKMQEIYTSEKMRNAVAYAHGCCDSHGTFKHYKALCYPDAYIVTDEQIAEAKREIARSKAEKLANLKKGILLFVGMGTSFTPRFDGDICNHRIRTEFKNNAGKRIFVEFCSNAKGNGFHCTHSVDRDLENSCNRDFHRQHEYYNFKQLERTNFTQDFSKENIISIINRFFECSYTDLEVDEYTLRTDDFVCECEPKTSDDDTN